LELERDKVEIFIFGSVYLKSLELYKFEKKYLKTVNKLLD